MAQEIAQHVKDSGQLSNYRLGVSFSEGVATLVGTVSDASQAKAAVRLTKEVAGVEQVVNKLQLEGQAQPQQQPAQPQQQARAAAFQAPEEEKSGGLLMTLRDSLTSQPKPAQPMPAAQQPQLRPTNNAPMPMGASNLRTAAYQQQPVQQAQCADNGSGYVEGGAVGGGYDNPNMPGYAWPTYAATGNYAALTYPTQYSPTAWPYIGPFYPYPQVPLGWREVTLEWDDGWWFLDFSHHQSH